MGERIVLQGQKVEKQSDWDLREKFHSDLGLHRIPPREQGLPCNMLFLWWSSVFPKDFLFLIWNLQTVLHLRLMVHFHVRWLTAAEKYPTFSMTCFACVFKSNIQLCVPHLCSAQLKEEIFLNGCKHGPPRGGIWVLGWICRQKILLFWVKSDCASASTDLPLLANAIYAIMSKTKTLLRHKEYCVQLSAWQLAWNHPICD